METVVHFGESAFLTILLSSIEVYPSKYQGERKPSRAWAEGEVYGLLFGQRFQKNDGLQVINASLAIPLRTMTQCDESGVLSSVPHETRIRELTTDFPTFDFLGTFHSHPYRRSEFKENHASTLSAGDSETALGNDQSSIEVVLALTWLSRRLEAHEPKWISNHRIKGYVGHYKYVLAAYRVDHEKGATRPVDNLLCPTALGIWNRDLGR